MATQLYLIITATNSDDDLVTSENKFDQDFNFVRLKRVCDAVKNKSATFETDDEDWHKGSIYDSDIEWFKKFTPPIDDFRRIHADFITVKVIEVVSEVKYF